MRYLFAFIVIVHGLIHTMGFLKAFHLAKIDQLSQSISKLNGMLWLLVAVLFIISVVLYLSHVEMWYAFGFMAVIISQLLIFFYWKDAKFGTIANLIILIVSLSAFGNYRFKNMVTKELAEILHTVKLNPKRVSEKDIQHLPQIVKKWLENSGVIESEHISTVQLKQVGEMRTKPNGKWMPFEAIQHFNVDSPSFIWYTKVDAMPVIKMIGRDKFVNGEGAMLIKLAGLFPLVNEAKNHKINSGTMIRFLSETCWFPSAALHEYISWESINETSAKATFTYNNESVTGVFMFTEKGELVSFKTERYYGGGKDAELEKWHVETLSSKKFNGITIPNKTKVIWKLKEGDFHWLNVEITELEYNFSKLLID